MRESGRRYDAVPARSVDASLLAERFTWVYSNIASAEREAGRSPSSVHLIAVSKTHSADVVAAAARLGHIRFGENRVQEAQAKCAMVADALCARGVGLEWHLLGHLQVNKARQAAVAFHWIHSVDTLELARRISVSALSAGRRCNVLIQVNVAEDPCKHGLVPAALDALVESIQEEGLEGIALRGVMTIGRADASASDTRRTFARLRENCERVRRDSGLEDFNELSMGMSGDYPAAIAEGATMVRVGTALFGQRSYVSI